MARGDGFMEFRAGCRSGADAGALSDGVPPVRLRDSGRNGHAALGKKLRDVVERIVGAAGVEIALYRFANIILFRNRDPLRLRAVRGKARAARRGWVAPR